MTGPKIKPIPPERIIDLQALDNNRCRECGSVINKILSLCDKCFDNLVKPKNTRKRPR